MKRIAEKKKQNKELFQALVGKEQIQEEMKAVMTEGKKTLDHFFCFVVFAFTKMGVSYATIFIYQVFGWPISVFKSSPGPVVIILRHRIMNIILFNGVLYVLRLFLKFKLGSMNTQNHKIILSVFVIPGSHIRQCPDAINAGICPEINKNHLPPKSRNR